LDNGKEMLSKTGCFLPSIFIESVSIFDIELQYLIQIAGTILNQINYKTNKNKQKS